MYRTSVKWTVIPLLVALLLLWPGAASQAAVCETPPFPTLTERVVGPYGVIFGVMPKNPTIGSVRVLVRVCDAATGEPSENVRVSLWPISPNEIKGGVILALGRFAGPGDYSTDVKVREPGSWHYELEVSGPQGTARFDEPIPVEVRGISSTGGALPNVVFFLASAALAGGAFYLIKRAR